MLGGVAARLGLPGRRRRLPDPRATSSGTRPTRRLHRLGEHRHRHRADVHARLRPGQHLQLRGARVQPDRHQQPEQPGVGAWVSPTTPRRRSRSRRRRNNAAITTTTTPTLSGHGGQRPRRQHDGDRHGAQGVGQHDRAHVHGEPLGHRVVGRRDRLGARAARLADRRRLHGPRRRATGREHRVRATPTRSRRRERADPSTITAPAAADLLELGHDATPVSSPWTGCSPAGICGTAGDGHSGTIANVQVSVRQGTGNYWNGSSFASALRGADHRDGRPRTGACTFPIVELPGRRHLHRPRGRAPTTAATRASSRVTFYVDYNPATRCSSRRPGRREPGLAPAPRSSDQQRGIQAAQTAARAPRRRGRPATRRLDLRRRDARRATTRRSRAATSASTWLRAAPGSRTSSRSRRRTPRCSSTGYTGDVPAADITGTNAGAPRPRASTGCARSTARPSPCSTSACQRQELDRRRRGGPNATATPATAAAERSGRPAGNNNAVTVARRRGRRRRSQRRRRRSRWIRQPGRHRRHRRAS